MHAGMAVVPFLLFLTTNMWATGSALYCLQCSSLEDPFCAEGLSPAMKCEGKVVGCMTYVGKMPIPGADVVMRGCADKDMGTFCQDVPTQDAFQHQFCLRTCFKSKCNSQPIYS